LKAVDTHVQLFVVLLGYVYLIGAAFGTEAEAAVATACLKIIFHIWFLFKLDK
jgi:hypothetical protein